MMMIIEVPESALFAEMPAELQKQIARLNGQFVEAMLIGTQPINGKKLIFVSVDATAEEVEYLTNNDLFDQDTEEQIAFNLGWTVLATEDTPINQALLLPYFLDDAVYDPETEEFTYTPVTDITGRVQVWAGKAWQY
jgi:hypothetical protein